MILTKRENQYSNNYIEYEVLEKEEVINIIKNLDEYEIKENLVEKAMQYSGVNGYAYAELDITDGSILYGYLKKGNSNLEPDLYLHIAKCESQHIDLLSTGDLFDEDEIKEMEALTDEEIYGEDAIDFSEAREVIIDKYEIDENERIKNCIIDDIEFDSYIYNNLDMMYECE